MSEYADGLTLMDDEDFVGECFEQIDRANQSPVYSDADQRAKECCAEARRRGRIDLYQRGFEAAYRVAKGDAQYMIADAQYMIAYDALTPP